MDVTIVTSLFLYIFILELLQFPPPHPPRYRQGIDIMGYHFDESQKIVTSMIGEFWKH